MKKYFFIFSIIALTSFSVKQFATKQAAEANQVNGYIIFTDSKPVSEYNFIATVKPNKIQTGTASGPDAGLCYCDLTYQQLRDNLIEVAKKKHKGKGNAIVINTDNNTGDIIELK